MLGGMDDSDAIIRVVILVAVLVLVVGRRRIIWGNLLLALVAIVGLAVIIDKFFL